MSSYPFEGRTVNCGPDGAMNNHHCVMWSQESNLNWAGEVLDFGGWRKESLDPSFNHGGIMGSFELEND